MINYIKNEIIKMNEYVNKMIIDKIDRMRYEDKKNTDLYILIDNLETIRNTIKKHKFRTIINCHEHNYYEGMFDWIDDTVPQHALIFVLNENNRNFDKQIKFLDDMINISYLDDFMIIIITNGDDKNIDSKIRGLKYEHNEVYEYENKKIIKYEKILE